MSISAKAFFHVLSNEIRLRCLILLQTQGELCVCELTHALQLSQPMISRHLALLREAGLVSDRRVGQWIYYSINPALAKWAAQVLATSAQGNMKHSPFTEDSQALADMPNRPGAACCV